MPRTRRQNVIETETIEMMNNINDFMNLCQQMSQSGNPAQFISQRYGINLPQNIRSSNDAFQYLLNNGRISQAQVNSAMQMGNNPMFKKMFGIK